MPPFLFSVFAATVGLFSALQAALNSGLGTFAGGAVYGALICYVIGCLGMMVMYLCIVVLHYLGVITAKLPLARGVRWSELPRPFELLGGACGALFMLTAVHAAPALGTATLFALVVVGQLSASVVADHYDLTSVRPAALPPVGPASHARPALAPSGQDSAQAVLQDGAAALLRNEAQGAAAIRSRTASPPSSEPVEPCESGSEEVAYGGIGVPSAGLPSMAASTGGQAAHGMADRGIEQEAVASSGRLTPGKVVCLLLAIVGVIVSGTSATLDEDVVGDDGDQQGPVPPAVYSGLQLVGLGVAACVAGALQPTQALLNHRLSMRLPHWTYAIFVSFTVSCMLTLVAASISVSTTKDSPAAVWQRVQGAPVELLLGAPCQLLVLCGGVLLPARITASLYYCLYITGELLCSLVLDTVGAFGLQKRSLTAGRVIGLTLVSIGAVGLQHQDVVERLLRNAASAWLQLFGSQEDAVGASVEPARKTEKSKLLA